MDPILGVAIFIIVWWLAFFAVLPIGAKSFHEADEAAPAGAERGAPQKPLLWIKVIWAAGIAIVVWIGVFLAVQADLFGVRS
ncbi:MAG: DUF1467 family protein [Hyphomonadaceae bacterium]